MALEVVRRSTTARQAGVITPDVIAVKNSRTIEFEWIDGDCGIELLQTTALSKILSPLVKLQKMDQQNLTRFNPFSRIDPRVEVLSIAPEMHREIQTLKQVEITENGVVHGDFHLRQLLCDSKGHCWVIDLDDMALGPPEVDLGNLVAYLATHPTIMSDSLLNSLTYWQHEIAAAWSDLGQVCDEDSLRFFIKASLIRRTLKRCEAGDYSLMRDCTNALLAFG